MLFPANPPCSLFTNGFCHLPSHSWLCLVVIGCPIARRFLVFLPPSTRAPSKLSARSFKKICWPANRLPLLVACSTGRKNRGPSSMWMARDKLPVNEHCRGQSSCQFLIVVLI